MPGQYPSVVQRYGPHTIDLVIGGRPGTLQGRHANTGIGIIPGIPDFVFCPGRRNLFFDARFRGGTYSPRDRDAQFGARCREVSVSPRDRDVQVDGQGPAKRK